MGSYYINIGNDADNGKYTDWLQASTIYNELLEQGNEIGTHSYTHPDVIDALTYAELKSEFIDSRNEINEQLNIKVRGAAVPGHPESLKTATRLTWWFPYVSGEFSGIGTGYRSAIGSLSPSRSPRIYFSPNITFDFTLIEFWGMTADQALTYWNNELDAVLKYASQPIIHWPWHDYGPTVSLVDGYTVEMYESFIQRASQENTEFTTVFDVFWRIRNHMWTDFSVEWITSNTAHVSVSVQPEIKEKFKYYNNNYTYFSLAIGNDKKISHVNNWYAYSDDKILLPRVGGEFEVTVGDIAEDVTRLISLPSRARLNWANGNGKNRLVFAFFGKGNAVVKMASPYSKIQTLEGADAYTINGDEITLHFTENTKHVVKLWLE